MNELKSVERAGSDSLPVAAPPKPMAVARAKDWALLATRPASVVGFHLNRLGNAGIAGVGLSLFAATLVFVSILPQHRQAVALEAQISQLNRQAAPSASPHERVSDFVLKLPARRDLPNVAGQIFALAATASVSLDKGRYELAPLKSGHLMRYRMSFPIKGSYTNIRHFLDSTLVALPAVSVEALRIERKNAGDAAVEADIRLNVFVRNEP